MKKIGLIISATISAFSLAAGAAPRTGPWTKEQAWEWYNAQPWIRGCNYMPASAANRYDMWTASGVSRRWTANSPSPNPSASTPCA